MSEEGRDDAWAPPMAPSTGSSAQSSTAPQAEVADSRIVADPKVDPSVDSFGEEELYERVDVTGLPDLPDDSLRLGPVSAAAEGASWAVRVLVVLGGVIVIAAAAALAFGAGTADSGAESPEAAFVQMVDAVSNEDLVAIAAVLDPAERESLLGGVSSVVDELIRLDGLEESVDLNLVDGVLVDATELSVRRERLTDDIALLFVGDEDIDFVVNVPESLLGTSILAGLTTEQQTFRESGTLTVGGDRPLVAVKRDGRWYLSVWYSLVHNLIARETTDLPDFSRSVPNVGAETPDGAVRGLAEDLVRLDIRRAFGALDPQQARVFDDYAWAVVDPLAESANLRLARLEADGWSWSLDRFDLDVGPITDGRAMVSVTSLHFTAQSEGTLFEVVADPDSVEANITSIDFWGDETRISVVAADGCTVSTYVDPGGSTEEALCGAELTVGTGLLGPVALAGSRLLQIATVERDGQWYVAPVDTGFAGLLNTLSMWTPDELTEIVSVLATGVAPSLDRAGLSVVTEVTDGAFSFEIDNGDLLSGVEPVFAYDLSDESLALEFEIFAPGLEPPEMDRGVYASVAGENGDLALLVLVVDDEVGAAVAASIGDDALDRDGRPVAAATVGGRLVITGSFGATRAEIESLSDFVLAGGPG